MNRAKMLALIEERSPVTVMMKQQLQRIAKEQRPDCSQDMLADMLHLGLVMERLGEYFLTPAGADALAEFEGKEKVRKAKKAQYARTRHSVYTSLGMVRTRSGAYESRIEAMRDLLGEGSKYDSWNFATPEQRYTILTGPVLQKIKTKGLKKFMGDSPENEEKAILQIFKSVSEMAGMALMRDPDFDRVLMNYGIKDFFDIVDEAFAKLPDPAVNTWNAANEVRRAKALTAFVYSPRARKMDDETKEQFVDSAKLDADALAKEFSAEMAKLRIPWREVTNYLAKNI